MLEVGFPGMPGTGGKSALAVTDVDEVAKQVARIVPDRLVLVAAFPGGYRVQVHTELSPSARDGEQPGAKPAGWARGLPRSENEERGDRRWRAITLALAWASPLAGLAAAVTDGVAFVVDDRHAELAVRVPSGRLSEPTG
jgi:hypothetical protein